MNQIEIAKFIEAHLRHLAHDVFVNQLLRAIQHGANPLEMICQTVIAQSGAIESHRGTLTHILMNSTHCVVKP